MTLLKFDGFDDLSDLGKRWTIGRATVSNTAARDEGRGLIFSENSEMGQAFDALSGTLVVGFAIKPVTVPVSTEIELLTFYNNSTALCSLRMTPSRTFRIAESNPTYTVGSSSYVLPSDDFSYVEVKILFSSSVGTAQLMINEESKINVTSVATGTLSSDGCDVLYFQTGADTTLYIDDVYILNDSGTTNNDFLGNVAAVYVPPITTEEDTSITSGSIDPHDVLDEYPADESDVVYFDNTGQKVRMGFILEDATTNYTDVFAVSVDLYGKRLSSSLTGAKPYLLYNESLVFSPNFGILGTDYEHREVLLESNPSTFTSWTLQELEDGIILGMEIGT